MTFSQNGQGYPLGDLIFYPNFGFGVTILAPQMLESQSRDLKSLGL